MARAHESYHTASLHYRQSAAQSRLEAVKVSITLDVKANWVASLPNDSVHPPAAWHQPQVSPTACKGWVWLELVTTKITR